MGCSEVKARSSDCQRLRVDSQYSCSTSGDTQPSVIPPLIIRAVLLGNASVGKSSLSVRYFNDLFPESYDITFGACFFKKQIAVSKDFNISLQAWDTGGQQRYRSMTPLYYRNASIAFLVCSVTDDDPISSLQYWFQQLSQKVQKDKMTIIVLANKCDLQSNDSAFTVRQWCSKNGLELIQCSAKTGQGVKQAFTRAVDLQLTKIGKVYH